MKFCVFDISNLLHRSFFANPNPDDSVSAGMAHHMGLNMLNKYYKQYRPDKIVMAFDRPNWRKDYTLSEECYSKREYKGLRNKDMTEGQKAHYNLFKNSIKEFEQLMREHTSVICLAGDKLEADDIVGGFVQAFSEDNEIVIVSSDKDYIQMLGHPNVTLIDPATDKPRTLEEWNNDPKYFIFEKCFRGESGASSDNIQSAYPRLRKTKIKEAYEDPFKFEQLLHETWKHVDGRDMEVKKIFNENKTLMDLTCQPDWVKERIAETIADGFNNAGRFSYFHFLQFCGKYKLERIAEGYKNYVKMLSK